MTREKKSKVLKIELITKSYFYAFLIEDFIKQGITVTSNQEYFKDYPKNYLLNNIFDNYFLIHLMDDSS